MPCTTIQFDPAVGPLLTVAVAPAKSLNPSAQQPGPFTRVEALIDTGASRTSITPQLAQSLKLPLVGQTTMISASGAAPANLYFGDFTIPFASLSMYVPDLELMEFQMLSRRFDILLGRDILGNCLFEMTGYTKTFTFCM